MIVRSLAAKFTSRKFLACLAGVVIGLCTVFGLEQNTVTTVSGAVVSLASLVTYIIAEGKIDAAAVLSAVEILQEAIVPEDAGSSGAVEASDTLTMDNLNDTTEAPVEAAADDPADLDEPEETDIPPNDTLHAATPEQFPADPAE